MRGISILGLFPLSTVLITVLGGCQSRPIEEMILADVAVRAAQKVKADSYAPDLFRKAENNFLRAKKDFADGYYDSCRKHATDARLFGEQSEFRALLKQSELRDHPNGDDFTPPAPSPPQPSAAPPGEEQ